MHASVIPQEMNMYKAATFTMYTGHKNPVSGSSDESALSDHLGKARIHSKFNLKVGNSYK